MDRIMCKSLPALRIYLNSQVLLGMDKKMKTFHDSDCKSSQLIKRRLESVASTGSSTSSGFIEDKSCSESDEEEESNRHLLGATTTHRAGMWSCFLANPQDHQRFEDRGCVGGMRPLPSKVRPGWRAVTQNTMCLPLQLLPCISEGICF